MAVKEFEIKRYFCFLFMIGFYCPGGQIVGNPSSYECPAGYFCKAGSSTYTICPSGTYQDLTGQSTCKTCLEGFYCDNSNGPITNYTLSVCPSGKCRFNSKKQQNFRLVNN